MSKQSTILFTGTALVRLEIAKNALGLNLLDTKGAYGSVGSGGHIRPVLHGVVVADGGILYTYTRGDHGGLAETVEQAVDIEQPVRGDIPDWMQNLTAAQIVEWEAMQPAPHPDAGVELAPCVEDSLADTSPTEDFLARMNAPAIPEGLAKLVDKVVFDAENLAREKAGMLKVDGRSKGNNRRYGPRFDHEKAMRMVEYGMRRTHIARHLGVTDQHVGKIALSRGVKVKPAIKGSRHWDRFAAYEEVKAGDSYGAVGRRHGVNPESIAKMVRYIDGEAA